MKKEFEVISQIIENNKRVLDIGCGDGTLMEYLKNQQQNDVRGLEPQKDLVQKCISKGLSVIEGDAEKELIQFPEKSFDYVVLSQTLQAFFNPEEGENFFYHDAYKVDFNKRTSIDVEKLLCLDLNRKIKELITALKIEQTYTKAEILELYFNSVYFGHGTYGVEAASKHYFGKNVTHINLDECAILISLLPAPARYSPIRHPEKSLFRRNLVLRVMRDQGYISEADYAITTVKDLPVRITSEDEGMAPYFSEYIRRQLEKIDEELDINLYKDGLVVHTTLDSRVQKILSNSFNMSMKKNQEILI